MKKRFLKLLAVVLCLCLVLTACGKDEPKKEDKPTTTPTETVTTAPTEAATEAPTEEPTETPTEEPTEAPVDETDVTPIEEPVDVEPTEAPVEGGDDVTIPTFDFSEVSEEGRAITPEELAAIASLIPSTASDSMSAYVDMEMTLGEASQNMTMYIYSKDGIQHSITSTNMLGADTTIETYSVSNEDGSTQYVNVGDGNWYAQKGASSAASVNIPTAESFAQCFSEGYIRQTTDGYVISGVLATPVEDGVSISLNVELLLNPDCSFNRMVASIPDALDVTQSGVTVTIAKFNMTIDSYCEDIEIPENVLNAQDISAMYGGGSVEEIQPAGDVVTGDE